MKYPKIVKALGRSSDSISSNIDEVLPINPSANVLVFGDLNIHHKDWLNYSCRTDWPGEFCYNFSFSNDLTQVVECPTQIPDSDSHSPALVFVLQWLFLHWEILIMLLPQFSLTSQSNSQWDALFNGKAYDYSNAE